MNINDLDKEQVLAMSEEEIYLTAEMLDKTERAELIRKKMLDAIDAKNGPRIHVASEVIDHA